MGFSTLWEVRTAIIERQINTNGTYLNSAMGHCNEVNK